MATNKNFVVKNGLIVGGQEVISSSGVVTSAALGGQTLSSTDSPTFANLTVSNDLAVSGDLNLTGDLNITGNVNTLSVTDLDVTDQTITLGAGQVESASGGSGIVIDGSNASILWDETNDVFDFNKGLTTTGNVGIGEDTPDYDLHIEKSSASANVDLMVRNSGTDGTSNTRIMSYVSSTSGGDPKIGLGITGVRDYFWRIDNSDSDKLKLDTNGTDILTINDSGNATFVGRITANDDLILQSDVDLHLIATNPNAGSSFQYGEITFGDSTSGQFINHAKIISSGNYANQSNLEFHTSDNNSSPLRLKIDPNGDISFYEDTGTTAELFWDASAESLGIGTTSISSKLHVDSSFDGPLVTIHQTGGASANNRGLDVETSSTGTTVQRWFNAGTELMRVQGNGNVGIGLGGSESNYPLAVRRSAGGGTYAINVDNYGSDAYLSRTIFHYAIGDNSGEQSAHMFFTRETGTTDSPRLTINSIGKVGIGTTSPDTKLHIVGNNSTRNSIVPNLTLDGGTNVSNPYDGFGFGINFKGRDYGNAIRNYAQIYSVIEDQSSSAGGGDAGFQSLLSFYTNSGGASNTDPTEKMRITSDGKVGIGTTSPAQKLSVDTGVSSLNQGIPATSGTTQNGILRLQPGVATFGEALDVGMNVGPTYAWVQPTNSSNLATNYNLVLNPNGGNVGIGPGKTAPSYRVDVNGNVRATAYSSDYIALYNIASGSYTAGTWYDFTDRTTIGNYGYGNGMYIFRVYDDTFGAGGGNYFINYLTEPFWFENTASNAINAMEFTVSVVAMGHAANGGTSNRIRVRLKENYGGVAHDFQWSPGGNNLTLDQTSGKRIYIYLHKWGGV